MISVEKVLRNTSESDMLSSRISTKASWSTVLLDTSWQSVFGFNQSSGISSESGILVNGVYQAGHDDPDEVCSGVWFGE